MIEDLPEKGLGKYAKPVGVVAAVTFNQSGRHASQQDDDGTERPQCGGCSRVTQWLRNYLPHG